MKEELFKIKRRKKVKQENICPEYYDFEHDKVKMEEIETMGGRPSCWIVPTETQPKSDPWCSKAIKKLIEAF